MRDEDGIIRAALIREGEAKVRIKLSMHALPNHYVDPAIQWLSELDEAERARNDASHASQMRTALSANKAAWIAANAAIVAAVIAIIGAIVTILAWLYPRH